MSDELSRAAKRIQDLLSSFGTGLEVVELPATTRTAADAAKAIGCSVGQIAKSIVFRAASGRPVMVVASGINRVNEDRISEFIGEAIGKADAAFVREKTGFAIGGVPPIGHTEPIFTIIDEELLQLGEIWAAAGTPNSVFKLNASNLADITGGVVRSIK
jgi:prolyl-tRNA editing enzyme YbaK/EbsC (Cys-tRNA(Pro) deacylase)